MPDQSRRVVTPRRGSSGGPRDTRNPPLKETGVPPFASSPRLRRWSVSSCPIETKEAAMNASEPTNADAAGPSRELASRESNGVHVLLLWHPRDDALTVSVEDSRAGQR